MAKRQLSAGVDCSTQSVAEVIRDSNTRKLVRQEWATHPDGTKVDPVHWVTGLNSGISKVCGIKDTAAVSTAGRQLSWKNTEHLRNKRNNGKY
jgi:hypothetical protein